MKPICPDGLTSLPPLKSPDPPEDETKGARNDRRTIKPVKTIDPINNQYFVFVSNFLLGIRNNIPNIGK